MLARFAVAGLAASCVALGTAGALAESGSAPPAPKVTKARFTMTSKQCKLLPPGITVRGQGTRRKWTYMRQDEEGVTHDYEVTVITGRATDNQGGRYRFDYHDTFSADFKAPPFIALLTDHFDLVGVGALPGGLHSYFVAPLKVLSASKATFLRPIVIGGDPIAFPSGAPHCDPL